MPERVAVPAPPGAYVELDIDLIDEGKLKDVIEQKLRQAHKGLTDYEKETGDLTAKATVTIKLKLQRQRGSQQFMDVLYHARHEVPVMERVTSVRAAGDKLLCQPAGSNEGDPDQQLFYDQNGRIIGGNPPKSEPKDVAGTIGKAVNA